MTTVSYREGFEAPAFIELAQRVWPGEYVAEQVAAALMRASPDELRRLGPLDATRSERAIERP